MNPLAQAGALSDPSRYAPLHTDRFFTGMWTQRSPLRDAAVPFLYSKFYAASRFDSLIDGVNTEISSRLTLIRRYGNSVYNSQAFDPIDRFYDFRIFSTNTQIIRVMADTATQVFDATGPSTKLLLFTKGSGAGFTNFQSVGNTLYMGDGVEQMKWVKTALNWAALTQFQNPNFIVDANNNIQVCIGSISLSISTVQITSNLLTLSLNNLKNVPVGTVLTLSGLVTATFLNGQTITVLSSSGNVITATFTHADYALATDSGTAATANGLTGASLPTWSTTNGGVTSDGSQQWVCRGSAVQLWGIVAPIAAPNVVNTPRPNTNPAWAANTYFITAIVDSNNNIQALTTNGQTGAVQPTWNVTLGGTTTDNGAVWTNKGTAAWQSAHAYALGDFVSVSAAIVTTTTIGDPSEGPVHYVTRVTYVTDIFKCTTAGTSGSTQPKWYDGVGLTQSDGTNGLVWTCMGAKVDWPTIGANTLVSNITQIVDSNGNFQNLLTSGKSAATVPTWNISTGSITADNNAAWTNGGPFSTAGQFPWTYAYAFVNSVTAGVSTASPSSVQITVAAGKLVTVQGTGSGDTQVDTIRIYRTAQNGSILLLLAEIPNPGAGQTWTFQDSNWDSALNTLIQADTVGNNAPPPSGLKCMVYYLGRVWGAVNNTLYYSTGPDTNKGNGNGNEGFNVSNAFVFPSAVVRLWPTPIGLIVFTQSDVYIVLGKGTITSTFYSIKFLDGIGLLNYDAFTVNGTTAYIMDSSKQVISLDPSAGVVEVGFPIGDQFASLYDPKTAYLTWHKGGSADTALFVADGSTGWFRMAATSAPETGIIWSPRAQIVGGCKAIQSIETSPGTKQLLLGPASGTGPILKRDLTVNTDNGTAFAAYATLGSIVLAQPGMVAELEFITIDSMRTGSTVQLGILLGEISGAFESTLRSRQDPPLLPASLTLYNDRYYFSQNHKATYCRHLQVKFTFATNTGANENAHNEILAYTIYGALRPERPAR